MAINLSNVHFTYPDKNSTELLNIPMWSVSKGEHVFIHGPSGSGKSTLLNVINGLLCVNKGEVNVLGKSLTTMSPKQRDAFRANNIGMVFQQFNLIPYLNALDNIRLANHFAKTGSKSGEKQAITQTIESLLITLNITPENWTKHVRQLSIGQQQRIAIARALVNKPSLLIADEPTSSLDKANVESFMNILMSVVNTHGITLLFVSHDLSLARYFERVESLADINQPVNQTENI